MLNSMKKLVFSLIQLVLEPVDPNVKYIDFAIVFQSDTVFILNHVIKVPFIFMLKVFFILWLFWMNRALIVAMSETLLSFPFLVDFEQLALVKCRTGCRHIVGQKSIPIQSLWEGIFRWSQFLLSLEGRVRKMLYSVLFRLLLWWFRWLSLQIAVWVVHGCYLNRGLVELLFAWAPRTFCIQRLLVTYIKTRCFWCKIYWGLVIVLIHLWNVERNQLCRWTALIVNKAGVIQILSCLRHLPFGNLVIIWLHFLHVLW
jgi:hypothetical protein